MINRRTFIQGCSGLLLMKRSSAKIRTDIFTTNKFRLLPKSLWVWSTRKTDLNEVSKFALKNGFNPLYIAFPPSLDSLETQNVKFNISRMQELGLDIYLAGGDPQWIMLPPDKNHHELLVKQALMMNTNGIAIDIEPQTKKDWQNPIKRQYLVEKYYMIIQQIDALAKNKNLPLVITSTPEYRTILLKNNKILLNSIGNMVQSEIIMSYHQSTIEALDHAQPALKQLELSQIPYWFGINISESHLKNKNLLGKIIVSSLYITSKLQSSKMFLGIAYNDYSKMKNIFNS